MESRLRSVSRRGQQRPENPPPPWVLGGPWRNTPRKSPKPGPNRTPAVRSTASICVGFSVWCWACCRRGFRCTSTSPALPRSRRRRETPQPEQAPGPATPKASPPGTASRWITAPRSSRTPPCSPSAGPTPPRMRWRASPHLPWTCTRPSPGSAPAIPPTSRSARSPAGRSPRRKCSSAAWAWASSTSWPCSPSTAVGGLFRTPRPARGCATSPPAASRSSWSPPTTATRTSRSRSSALCHPRPGFHASRLPSRSWISHRSRRIAWTSARPCGRRSCGTRKRPTTGFCWQPNLTS